MRILLLTQYFPPEVGAAQARIAFLARHLRDCGDEVIVVTASPNYPDSKLHAGYENVLLQKEDWEGIEVHRTWVYLPVVQRFMGRLINLVSFSVSALLALWKTGEVDVILVETPPLFLSFTAWCYGLLKRAPIVVQYSDLWVRSAVDLGYVRGGFWARKALQLENTALKVGRYVVAVTPGLMEDLVTRGFDPERIRLITNGVDCDHYCPGDGSSVLRKQLGLDNKFVVMFAGTISHQSGVAVILDAAECLQPKEEVRFVMVGGGVEAKPMQQAAKERGLNNILFCGFQPEQDLPDYLHLAHVGLNTLSSDPFTDNVLSVKLLSYMACGLPLISTDRRTVSALLKKARAGMVIPPEDPAALAEAVLELQRSANLRRRLGENGRTFVVQHYHRSAKAQEIRRLLSFAVQESLGC